MYYFTVDNYKIWLYNSIGNKNNDEDSKIL